MLHLAVLAATFLSCVSFGAERETFTLNQEPCLLCLSPS